MTRMPYLLSCRTNTRTSSRYLNYTADTRRPAFLTFNMKSPIYLLTALLPLTLPLVNATPTAEPDDLEVEGSVLEDRDNCRVERPFVYRKYPCDSSDITGRANRGDNVNFQCRYRYVLKVRSISCY